MKRIFNFFDKLEDVVRGSLSHHPIIYGFIGGTLVVLYWRGVWHTADILEAWGGYWSVVFSGPAQIIITAVLLMLTGLAVSVFIGESIIISGLKHEKKVFEKTEEEVKQEKKEIISVEDRLSDIERKIDELTETMKR